MAHTVTTVRTSVRLDLLIMDWSFEPWVWATGYYGKKRRYRKCNILSFRIVRDIFFVICVIESIFFLLRKKCKRHFNDWQKNQWIMTGIFEWKSEKK